MADEKQLSHKKKVRGGHRAYAKMILSKINTVLEVYDTENDRKKLEGYKVILKERFETIKTLDAVILDAAKEEEILTMKSKKLEISVNLFTVFW